MNLGIFGGSFAPFHLGHRTALEEFRSGAELDRCLVVPSAQPPHKQKSTLFSDRQRLDMTRLGTKDLSHTEVWDWEINQGGRSYTIFTLRECHRRWPSARLLLYVGSDMLLSIETWYRPEEIFQLAEIVAFSRTGQDRAALEKHRQQLEARFSLHCRILPGTPFPVSSTQIRERLAQGKDISDLVPEPIDDYLRREGFYGIR